MGLTKVSTDGVKDDAITSGKIPANAVGASELADNAVDTNAIADDAVNNNKIANSAVNTLQLADNAVHTQKINDDAITTDKLANSIVNDINANSAKVQTTINNNADNRIITGSGSANTLNGESNVVVDSSGNVGIGTKSPSQQLSLVNSSASKINIRGGGASTGYFLAMPDATNAQVWNAENGYIQFATNDTERMRILAGGGLTFNGDTATANALDDYETGTYSVTITGSSGGSATLSNNYGVYTKIGRLVTVNMNVSLTNKSNLSGDINISLPFTVADLLSSTSLESNGIIGFFANLATASSHLGLTAINGGTVCQIRGVESKQVTTATTFDTNDITNTFEFRGTISYFV